MSEASTTASMRQELSGGRALAEQLAACGCSDVFGLAGWQLDWAFDGLAQVAARHAIRFYGVRHEQAAAYMADGYARSTGRVGVIMVGPGPGLTNALAGLGNAYACSSPVVCIAGQIPTDVLGRNLGVHHEICNQSQLLATVTKRAELVTDPRAIQTAVREAVADCQSGRPRPVGIEVPPDVLSARALAVAGSLPPRPLDRIVPDPDVVARAAAVLREARRPVIYAGGGVAAAGASEELRMLAELLQSPVVMSENGRGVLSDRHPLALTPLARRISLRHADVVVVVGSRYLTDSGSVVWQRSPQQLIHVNADPRDMADPRRPSVALHADAKLALAALIASLHDVPRRETRHDEVRVIRAWCAAQIAQLRPQSGWVEALRSAVPEDGIVVSELTQVAYVAQIAFPVYEPHGLLTSGYAGTLGFGFPTALGVAVGNKSRPVVSVTGDGGFGFNFQELSTACAYDLNLVVIVFNDCAFGNVRRMQQAQFGRNIGDSLHNPDFLQLAAAFGAGSMRIAGQHQLVGAVTEALATPGPVVIDVPVADMPSPWHLIHDELPSRYPVPPDPLTIQMS